jgi:hypothetical protein
VKQFPEKISIGDKYGPAMDLADQGEADAYFALFHYSKSPLVAVRSVDQPTKEEGWLSPYKPKGLWLSVDDEWAEWCRSESFNVDSLSKRYRIELADAASLLWLRTAEDIREFARRYKKEIPGFTYMTHIDWRRVAAEYPGIVIAPYRWSCRLELQTHWYYGWDCASGCIWDAAVVAHIEEAPEPERLADAGGGNGL